MPRKKIYNIQLKDRKIDPEGKLPWFQPIECTAVSMEFIRGYTACLKGYYPCPEIKIMDYYTKEIVKQISSNGEVVVNKLK